MSFDLFNVNFWLIHYTLVFYQFLTTIDTFYRNQTLMVITVVNIMLPRVTVLKKYCLSTKLHFLWYSHLRLSHGGRLLASFSLFIDLATRLEFESF